MVPIDETPDWAVLYGRIGAIAHDYAGCMLTRDGDDETLNRGARTLRALVGAADLVRRMRRADDEARAASANASKTISFTDAELRSIYDTISRQIDAVADPSSEFIDTTTDAQGTNCESDAHSSDAINRPGGGVA